MTERDATTPTDPVHLGPAPAGADARTRGEASEAGIVAAWVGITLTVLLAMAGFATDMAYWYLIASRAQNAADAAALGGVTYLPERLADARTVADRVARSNGFSNVSADAVRSNQLRVTVTAQVDTFFARLVGVPRVTIRRASIAEFEQPVAMGSPDATLGNDPDEGYLPNFWVNVGASQGYKENGDRFNTKTCGASDYRCSTATTPNNEEYSTDGTFYGIDAPGSGPMRVQLFDPIYAPVGNLCNVSSVPMPSSAQRDVLEALPVTATLPASFYADADVRYASGAGSFCSGDQDLGPSSFSRPVTTAILRAPDRTAWDDTDNPVICTARFGQFRLGNGGSSTPSVYQLLHPADGVRDSDAVVNPNDGVVTFAEGFRRWVTVCDISNPVQGTYILQLRTNASSSDPLVYDASVEAMGYNRVAIRAGVANGTNRVNGNQFNIYARGRLPIYANTGATSFRAARVLPGGTGRVLEFTLFDMGDASTAGTLRFRPPADSNYASFSSCSFSRSDGATLSFDAATCRLSGISAAAGFNGRLVTAQIPIPDDYDCDENQFSGCWVVVEPQFSGGSVTDSTTWTAAMLGSPVRLIQ